jgi:nitrile hydratase accessory protein
MVERRKFAELGGADNGWLKAKPTLPMRCISTCGTTILTPYEVIDALPGVPRDSSGPVFAEPWQAQNFALTVQLSQAGYFRWREWADTLAVVLREAVALDPRDDGSRYYEHWLIALERLCLAEGLTDSEALDMRTAAWVDAYRRGRTDDRWNLLAGRFVAQSQPISASQKIKSSALLNDSKGSFAGVAEGPWPL